MSPQDLTPSSDAPLLADIAAACERLLSEQPTGVVLAVSGGPDSVALMHLFGPPLAGRVPLWIATVDHGLRPGSAEDTAFVVAEAQALGFDAQILAWVGPKPRTAVQERARIARYALLTRFCHAQFASHLLTAHTLDDQAETILFRLARGSGVAGLSGMSERVMREDIVHLRPLLGVTKAQLVDCCRTGGWSYRTDPSNDDPRFARSRMRRLLPVLAGEQLDATRLAKLAARVRRSETALQKAADAAWATMVRDSEPGLVCIDGRHLACEPTELMIRVLGRAIRQVGGERPVRLDALEALADALLPAIEAALPLGRTLGGTILRLAADGKLRVTQEGLRLRGTTRRTGPARDGMHDGDATTACSASLGNGERDTYIGD